MSDIVSTSRAAVTPVPVSIIDRLEMEGHACLTAVEHAAAWLVGKLATARDNLHDLDASSPWVASAWEAGIASATAHGIPVAAIEDVGAQILEAAKAFAAGLAQSAPAVPPGQPVPGAPVAALPGQPTPTVNTPAAA